ncbi:MAG TPA: hypothetical protein ENH82_04590 [bacterium]|nr:hypothetical protein [bacterium]
MAYFPDNSKDWKKIASLIERSENVFISSHVNPDGDAIGSEMAFAGFLRNMNKKYRVINHSSTPEIYTFLDPENIIESFTEDGSLENSPEKDDIVICLDLGSFYRLGDIHDFLVNNEAQKIIIDHHIPEPVEADVVVVNSDASSTASLIYDLFCYIDISLVDKRVAASLLTAILTDTGYFSYSNTTSTTHHIAAALYNHGATASRIRNKIDSVQPLFRQKLLGLALTHVQVTDCGRIGYSYLTQSMFKEAGAQREHTEDIINEIRIIKNIEIAMLFIQETENKFKISLRSAGAIPVNVIASKLGGGGHKKAAGALMEGSLEEVISKALSTAEDVLDDEV